MAYKDRILADSPIRYYRLNTGNNTSVQDSSGSGNNATATGGITSGVTGIFGAGADKAFTFDGSTGWVGVPVSGLPTGNSAWTMEAWVNIAGTSNSSGVVIYLGTFGTSNQSTWIKVTGSTVIADTYGSADLTIGTLTVGTWAHVVTTWDGTTLRGYFNGSAAGTLTPGTLNIGTHASLGKVADNNFYFGGSIDEAAYYSTALSAARISAHYSAASSGLAAYTSAVLADSPLRFYHLNDAVGIMDSSTSRADTSATGSPTVVSGLLVGDSDHALSFNGTTQYITIPGSGLPIGHTTFSIECWIQVSGYPVGGNAAGRATVALGHYAAFAEDPVTMALLSSGSLHVDGVGAGAGAFNTGSIALNTPHHLVTTYDGSSTAKLYLDGALVSTYGTANPSLSVEDTARIGYVPNFNDDTRYFPGIIDEVAIYNYVLTSTQVTNHYSAGISNFASGQLTALASGSVNAHLLANFAHISGVMQAVATGSMSASTVVHVLFASGILKAVATGSASPRLIQHVKGTLAAIASGSVNGRLFYHLIVNALAIANGTLTPTLTTPLTPQPFTPSSIQDVADNIARTLLDLQALYVQNPTVTAPTSQVIIAGQTDPSLSFLTRLANLPDLQQKADLIPNALRSVERVLGTVAIPQTAFYDLYDTFLTQMDKAVGGLSAYLLQHNIQVHPEFANAFNHVARNAIALGVSYIPLVSIRTQSVFVPASTFLGSYAVTPNTFVATSGVDTTHYGASPLAISFGWSRAGTYTVNLTYTDNSGSLATSTILVPATPSGTQLLGVSGTSIANASVTGPVQAGDVYQFFAQPVRIPAY